MNEKRTFIFTLTLDCEIDGYAPADTVLIDAIESHILQNIGGVLLDDPDDPDCAIVFDSIEIAHVKDRAEK